MTTSSRCIQEKEGKDHINIDEEDTSFSGVLRNGIPAILNNAAAPAALLINLAIFSRAGGSEWMAAWAIIQSTVTFVQGVFNFLLYVPMAQISHSVGRGAFQELPRRVFFAIGTGFVVGTICSISLCWGVLYPLKCVFHSNAENSIIFKNHIDSSNNNNCDGFVLQIMNVDQDVRSIAALYLLGRMPSILLVFVNRVCTGILVGKQRIRLVTAVNLMTNGLDVIGNGYVLLYLKSGIFEAGLATSIAAFIGILLLLPVSILLGAAVGETASKEQNQDEDNVSAVGLQHDNGCEEKEHKFSILDFLRSSMDMMLRSVLLQAGMYSLSIAASRIGTPELAAHQVILQIWSLVSFCCDGFADVGTMVGGRLLGSSQHKLMVLLTKRLLAFGLFAGILCMAMLLEWQDWIISRFVNTDNATNNSNDSETKQVLDSVWVFTAVMQPINALVFVSDGLLFGHQAFAFIRNLMFIGVLGIFAPFLVLGFHAFHTLLALWVAKSMLSIWRCCAAIWFCFGHYTHWKSKDAVVETNVLSGLKDTEASPLLPP